MSTARVRVLLFTAAILSLSIASCGPQNGDGSNVVLYGFSIMENVMKQDIIPAFKSDWKSKTGADVEFITSFSGSGTITNQIAFGAPAHVGILAMEMHARSLKEAGIVTTDWRTFKNQGTFAYSVACIVTRAGNPMGIISFDDALRPGIDVVLPDPTTSGGAQWAILALYGSAIRGTGAQEDEDQTQRGRDMLRRAIVNASSLPESARRALTQFWLGFGDVLLTYENEALLDASRGRGYGIIVPEATIRIEPKVVIVDRNVGDGQRAVVEAFVDFLWSKGVQEAMARNHFRVWDEDVMAQHERKYGEGSTQFTVESLGGWEQATATIIDGAWKQVQREVQ